MRFVPANFLQEGMVLGKPLGDNLHHVLLNEGHVLTESTIERIIEMGYQGLYIEWSNTPEEIETAKDVISTELRDSVKKMTRELFLIEADNQDQILDKQKELQNMIMDIVEELLKNDSLIINIADLKTYDNYTFEHSVNVAVLAIIFGVYLKMSKQELFYLGFGAITHDLGKRFINIDLLNKKEPLSGEEMQIIKNHAEDGKRLLNELFNAPEAITDCALLHHERYDGKGYPLGLKGDQISLSGRIIAICDVFDALTSNRCYRGAIPQSEAVGYISANRGTHFDGDLVEIFLRYVPVYPVGTVVLLSNGIKGIIISNTINNGSRPIVKVLYDPYLGSVRPYDLDMSRKCHEHVIIRKCLNDI